MVLHPEPRSPADPGQELRQVAALHFHDLTAATAEQMMAVSHPNRGVAVAAGFGVDPAREALLNQEFQGPIDGDQAHPGANSLCAAIRLGCG